MFLQEPGLKNVQVGSTGWFELQRSLIHSKPLLKYCYDKWYAQLLSDEASVPSGQTGIVLELGSGGGYLKALKGDLVTSDVTEGVADRLIDARDLPFPDQSVRAIFLTHALHHVPDVDRFFREADRVLVKGGVISMIEVAHTPFAKFFFSHFHHEAYDDGADNWAFNQIDPMNDSNQALSWMIFKRDYSEFMKKYPDLKLEVAGFLPWFSYLLSGGVTRKALLPQSLWRLGPAMDWLLSPLSPLFSLHWHLRIRKSL